MRDHCLFFKDVKVAKLIPSDDVMQDEAARVSPSIHDSSHVYTLVKSMQLEGVIPNVGQKYPSPGRKVENPDFVETNDCTLLTKETQYYIETVKNHIANFIGEKENILARETPTPPKVEQPLDDILLDIVAKEEEEVIPTGEWKKKARDVNLRLEVSSSPPPPVLVLAPDDIPRAKNPTSQIVSQPASRERPKRIPKQVKFFEDEQTTGGGRIKDDYHDEVDEEFIKKVARDNRRFKKMFEPDENEPSTNDVPLSNQKKAMTPTSPAPPPVPRPLPSQPAPLKTTERERMASYMREREKKRNETPNPKKTKTLHTPPPPSQSVMSILTEEKKLDEFYKDKTNTMPALEEKQKAAKERYQQKQKQKEKPSSKLILLKDVLSVARFRSMPNSENSGKFLFFKTSTYRIIQCVANELLPKAKIPQNEIIQIEQTFQNSVLEAAKDLIFPIQDPVDEDDARLLNLHRLMWLYTQAEFEELAGDNLARYSIKLSRPMNETLFKNVKNELTLVVPYRVAVTMKYMRICFWSSEDVESRVRANAKEVLRKNKRKIKDARSLVVHLTRPDLPYVHKWFNNWCVAAVFAGVKELAVID